MVRVYANMKETPLRSRAKKNAKVLYYALLGQHLTIIDEDDHWYKVIPLNLGRSGWVLKSDTTEKTPLKIFVVDVGQGDGIFLECEQGLVVIDGGQYDNFYRYLKYRYKGILKKRNVRIKAMFVSHPDYDHYRGLDYIIRDKRFEVDTIYHNGIVRYEKSIEDSQNKMLDRRGIKKINNQHYTFKIPNLKNNLDDIVEFIEKDEPAPAYRNFWRNIKKAKDDGRVGKVKMLTSRDKFIPGFNANQNNKVKIEVLGPVTLRQNGKREFPVFGKPAHIHDESDNDKNGYSHSHTRNGHSLVLKLSFGDHTYLFGGDLNIPAEKYLMNHYGDANPFKVDIAKSCHHGSSDFSVEFIKKINARVTICSSGDNKTFDHPMPDSIGAAAKYGRGKIPLVFSTELGRAYQISRATTIDDIKTHFGLVNIRSNGKILVVAQKKESSRGADIWDSFEVPFKGKYKE